jgi:hypothetical protein
MFTPGIYFIVKGPPKQAECPLKTFLYNQLFDLHIFHEKCVRFRAGLYYAEICRVYINVLFLGRTECLKLCVLNGNVNGRVLIISWPILLLVGWADNPS